MLYIFPVFGYDRDMHPGPLHSNFFLDTIRRKRFSREFFRIALPENIRNLVELNSSRVESSHYVDERLKHHQSDIVFSVRRRSGESLKLYLLFEHKSHPDRRILLQLLKYLRQIHSYQSVPEPVLPLVFYHGQKDWNIPSAFQELFEWSKEEQRILGSYALNFRYLLVNVREMKVEEIRTSLAFRVFLAVLRDIWSFSSEERLGGFLRDYREIFFDSEELEFVEKLLVYIYRVRDMEPERLAELITENVSEEKGEMTLAMLGRREREAVLRGRQEGNREGKLEGKLEDAHRMLAKGYPMSDIVEITGLDEKQLRELGNGKR